MTRNRHPVENAIAQMSPRDQEIANQLHELGYTDEDLYAALPNPGADALLQQAGKQVKKKPADGGREGGK